MLHEEKKVAKIVEELTLFFYGIGADTMKSSIKNEKTCVKIDFESNYNIEHEHYIKKLEEYLTEPRNECIEGTYWELAGTGDPGEASQLLLLGMMVDEAVVEKKDGFVKIKLLKKNR
ncbi:MAG: hypothetical protein ACRC7V_03340 [Lachnospiraceae bacterium]